MEFGEMKRNTSKWSNFCMLLRRAGLTASAGLSCSVNRAVFKSNRGLLPFVSRLFARTGWIV